MVLTSALFWYMTTRKFTKSVVAGLAMAALSLSAVWSAQRAATYSEALEKAVSWCREHQLEFDAINDNLPEIVEMYGNNSRKITCDYYINDKAVLPAMVNG